MGCPLGLHIYKDAAGHQLRIIRINHGVDFFRPEDGHGAGAHEQARAARRAHAFSP